MTVHCRIMKIDIEKFSADLTCRTSDLMDRNNEWKLPKDTYYDFDAEAADHKQEEDMKRKQQRTSECSVPATVPVRPKSRQPSYRVHELRGVAPAQPPAGSECSALRCRGPERLRKGVIGRARNQGLRGSDFLC